MVQPLDRHGVFGADVDVGLVGAEGVGADHHAFQDRMRVAFQGAAVHEGPGVALVGVADDVLLVARRLAAEAPFHAGQEAGAAAAAQPGFQDDLDDLLGGVFLQHFLDGLVAAAGDVFVDGIGIDDAAVAQDDALLLGEEGILGDGIHSLDDPLPDGLVVQDLLVKDALDLLGGHVAVHVAAARFVDDLDQDFLVAVAHAARFQQVHLDVLPGDLVLSGPCRPFPRQPKLHRCRGRL